MGRKFLFLPILLLGTLISYSSAFATMQTEDGQTWYSAKEMMAITESDKKKVLSLCEEYDYNCWREVYNYMQSNRDVKYFIADLFAAKMFVPHVINHEKEEMKGIFRDGALLDYGYEGLAHYPMDAIYMAWFDIPTAIDKSEPDIPNDTEDLPLAPNTGGGIMAEDAKCEKRIEFPWWIVALIAAGEVLIIWWFAPNHRKYPKK